MAVAAVVDIASVAAVGCSESFRVTTGNGEPYQRHGDCAWATCPRAGAPQFHNGVGRRPEVLALQPRKRACQLAIAELLTPGEHCPKRPRNPPARALEALTSGLTLPPMLDRPVGLRRARRGGQKIRVPQNWLLTFAKPFD